MILWSRIKGWRRKLLRTNREVAEDMILEFERRFPGVCPVCSYYRFGVQQGFRVEEIDEHRCPEEKS